MMMVVLAWQWRRRAHPRGVPAGPRVGRVSRLQLRADLRRRSRCAGSMRGQHPPSPPPLPLAAVTPTRPLCHKPSPLCDLLPTRGCRCVRRAPHDRRRRRVVGQQLHLRRHGRHLGHGARRQPVGRRGAGTSHALPGAGQSVSQPSSRRLGAAWEGSLAVGIAQARAADALTGACWGG